MTTPESNPSSAASPILLADGGPVDYAADGLSGNAFAAPDRLVSTAGALVAAVQRLGKALLVAIGLSLLASIPTLITHLPTALLAPITAGYTTGGILRLTGKESAALSVVFLLLIGIPLPIAHLRFGVLATLGTPTVVFFSVFAAIYYAVLIGAFAWVGGGGLSHDAR